ncbi:hypothetical protein V6N13_006136 [Hibiscus sabdariffa]|uniref:Uncharacterized protein n=1 Tax=Hibiscus sabdariffa TaxID=183260 RepID=A0ABR2ENP4_9ROSI
MARIDFVVFSLVSVLSIQFVTSNRMQLKGLPKISSGHDANEKVIQLPNETTKFISEGLQEASEKGLVKDMGDHFVIRFSPQQEDAFFTKIIKKTMKKMENDRMADSKVLKEALFPKGSKTMNPEVKSVFIQAIKDAMSNAHIVKYETNSTTRVF